MPYLKSLICVPRDLFWVDAANHHPSMLSYDSEPILGKNVRGTTDVAICTRVSVKTFSPQLGVRLALVLKKRVNTAAVAQARATLLLANCHAPEMKPVVVSNFIVLATIGLKYPTFHECCAANAETPKPVWDSHQ